MDTKTSLRALSTPLSPAMFSALEAIAAYVKTRREMTRTLAKIQMTYRRPGQNRSYKSPGHVVVIAVPANDN